MEEGVPRCDKKFTLRKSNVFVVEKYVEDVKQDQKTVPDLLESIIRPTDPVKEELRRILCKLSQFRPEIIKVKVCIFAMSGKIPDSANAASETVILTHPQTLFAIFGRASDQIFEKIVKNK